MVSDPADCPWASYQAHAFGRAVKIWQPHPDYLALGDTATLRMSAYRQFFTQQLAGQVIADIRDALNTGLVLGNVRFRQEVERLTGQRQHHLKRGPKPTLK